MIYNLCRCVQRNIKVKLGTKSQVPLGKKNLNGSLLHLQTSWLHMSIPGDWNSCRVVKLKQHISKFQLFLGIMKAYYCIVFGSHK